MAAITVGTAAVAKVRFQTSAELVAAQTGNVAIRQGMVRSGPELADYVDVTVAAELRIIVQEQVLVPALDGMAGSACHLQDYVRIKTVVTHL
jgi:hypothetical protein